MEELIEKLEQLKLAIFKEKVVLDFLEAKNDALNDTLLMDEIKEYKRYPKKSLKKEIIVSPSFLRYKEKENEVLFLILKINESFKVMNSSFACRRGE